MAHTGAPVKSTPPPGAAVDRSGRVGHFNSAP
eukprot:CAMPEP_0119523626 /NCGR_PEP_ID=MMETSP1344-20130328/38655_1 /TAXON_ID=236787 /ORGANISM="Florenciella parvula, Strain CCMP2471" /LENGTH=31 /DNA_ID= /DNA_START= /DNA_END= /DNA_ORIENTATION=